MVKEEDQIPCPLPLPLLSLNHVSFVCKSVTASTKFYENVLGFQPVRRPSSFDFEGAWLFNYGVGIHLLQCRSLDNLPQKTEIDPKDNHISFQCPDTLLVEKKLQEMEIKYEKRVLEDEGLYVDQLFFHDPDGNMVEICNCENLPVIPAPSFVRSTSLQFALSQSQPKMELKESCSEIALVPMNVAAAQVPSKESCSEIASVPMNVAADQVPLPKKIAVTTGAETRYSSDAHDKGPFFLNIMDFYL